ncbi:hypothetical protein HYZ98_01480 [Candidatus Peregrinibacteria bacterium]|nr:hypothetical protein [Candidatus Peregrinibacteria bacterium]
MEILTVIVIIVILIALLLPAIESAQDAMRRQAEATQAEAAEAEAAEEWKYEKYFEDVGNGVYYFEGAKFRVLGNERMTQGLAKVLSEWRALHPDRRIVSVIEKNNCFILITEAH